MKLYSVAFVFTKQSTGDSFYAGIVGESRIFDQGLSVMLMKWNETAGFALAGGYNHCLWFRDKSNRTLWNNNWVKINN